MRFLNFIALFLLFSCLTSAQMGNEAFPFLRQSASAHANALGGQNVSIIECDPSLIFHNPGVLGKEMDNIININYMNYISDINIGNAIYTKAINEHNSFGIGLTYMSYGNFSQTSINNESLGTFPANDIAFSGVYARDLSEKLRGGVSIKMLYSSFEKYTSFGIGVDVGLSYYHPDKKFSAGIVIKNIGAQLKSYNKDRLPMPWEIQMGISQKLSHAPIRLSFTARHLNKWDLQSTTETRTTISKDNFGETLFKHLIFGVDFIPSDNIWIGLGYNPKTHYDMQLQSGNILSGFTAGGGFSINQFDLGFSFAQYHPSAWSMQLSLSMYLGNRKL